MLIIGFDPGTVSCGLGIINKEGKKFSYVFSEEIKLNDKDLMIRMKTLWQRIKEVTSRWDLNQAAVEEGYLGKNAKAMSMLDKIRGIILASLFDADINIVLYSPREVKLFVTGSGNAMKSQVKKMIKILLKIDLQDLGDDESDALAVAYCHGMKLR
jgi:crossover junction endodeoxyribonuclease RuvC